jgi:hypothetical protein
VHILDAHPLHSKKARDFAVWREAVLLWTAMTPRHVKGQQGPVLYDWAPILALRDQLIAGRRYG